MKYLVVNTPGHFIKVNRMKVRTPARIRLESKQDVKMVRNTILKRIKESYIEGEDKNIIDEKHSDDDIKKDKYERDMNYNAGIIKTTKSVIQENTLDLSESKISGGSDLDYENEHKVEKPKRKPKEKVRRDKIENVDIGETNISHIRNDIIDECREDFCMEDDYDD